MITFEELLNKASENLKMDGKELSKELIKIFCILGTKKEKQIEGISSTIFILLKYNNYYDNITNDFWDLNSIKEYVRKCL